MLPSRCFASWNLPWRLGDGTGADMRRVNALHGAVWKDWVDLNYQIAHDPSILGAADHVLYVGRKGH